MKKISISISALALALFPLFALAQVTVPTVPGLSTEELPDFIMKILGYILGIIGILLVIMLIYGGITYATAAGNEDRIETGKKIMMYAIIGIVIVAAAYVLANWIVGALFPK